MLKNGQLNRKAIPSSTTTVPKDHVFVLLRYSAHLLTFNLPNYPSYMDKFMIDANGQRKIADLKVVG